VAVPLSGYPVNSRLKEEEMAMWLKA